MKAQINADFPINLDSADDILTDLVDFEDKMTQAISEMAELESAHGLAIDIETKSKDGEDVLEITISNADANAPSESEDGNGGDTGGDDDGDDDEQGAGGESPGDGPPDETPGNGPPEGTPGNGPPGRSD